jgi:hypothetical protein
MIDSRVPLVAVWRNHQDTKRSRHQEASHKEKTHPGIVSLGVFVTWWYPYIQEITPSTPRYREIKPRRNPFPDLLSFVSW